MGFNSGIQVSKAQRANHIINSDHPTQRKSIDVVCKVLNRQIASIDQDIDAQLKDHFAAKLILFKNFKGIGTGTQACLMAALPELGELSHEQISKLVGVAPLNCDSGKPRVSVLPGAGVLMCVARYTWQP